MITRTFRNRHVGQGLILKSWVRRSHDWFRMDHETILQSSVRLSTMGGTKEKAVLVRSLSILL